MEPDIKKLEKTLKEGYSFVAFSMDSRFLIDGISKIF